MLPGIYKCYFLNTIVRIFTQHFILVRFLFCFRWKFLKLFYRVILSTNKIYFCNFSCYGFF
jgi:hypothetical protein